MPAVTILLSAISKFNAVGSPSNFIIVLSEHALSQRLLPIRQGFSAPRVSAGLSVVPSGRDDRVGCLSSLLVSESVRSWGVGLYYPHRGNLWQFW